MLTQEKKLNTFANNITNASTVGYKKDSLVSGTFGEHLAVRMNAYQNVPYHQIGSGVFMQVIDEKYTDYAQGAFEDTLRPMDVAIAGEGYFVIGKEDGNEYLTRDGQFSLDEEGYLVLPGFGRVLGESGELNIGTSNFSVDRQGYIYVTPFDAEPDDEPELLDRLLVVEPTDYETFDKSDDKLFATDEYEQVSFDATNIYQGRLERSNVNMAEEMTRVISSQRALQSCSQIVKMYDSMAEEINTRISRI